MDVVPKLTMRSILQCFMLKKKVALLPTLATHQFSMVRRLWAEWNIILTISGPSENAITIISKVECLGTKTWQKTSVWDQSGISTPPSIPSSSRILADLHHVMNEYMKLALSRIQLLAEWKCNINSTVNKSITNKAPGRPFNDNQIHLPQGS